MRSKTFSAIFSVISVASVVKKKHALASMKRGTKSQQRRVPHATTGRAHLGALWRPLPVHPFGTSEVIFLWA